MTKFPFETAEHEAVACNLCGSDQAKTLRNRDRNGLNVTTSICRRCGLIYINPRMIPRWYTEYYNQEYRAQMARFKGKPVVGHDYDSMFRNSTKHGVALAGLFRQYWEPGLTVEVGSSVGGVLNGIRQTFDLDVIGIEPASSECDEANARGVKTFNASIESFNGNLVPAANIICTQSLNHFLDPHYFFSWAYERLRPNGRLVLEVMNFRHVFRHFRWMPRAIQIDHTYMFVPEVLTAFAELAGFEILAIDSAEHKTIAEIKAIKKSGLPGFHVGIVAKKTNHTPFSGKIKEQFQEVQSSLDAVPESFAWYFLKFGLKKLFKTRIV